MKRVVWVFAAAVLVLAGCGQETTDSGVQPSTSATAAAASTTAQPTTAAEPSTELPEASEAPIDSDQAETLPVPAPAPELPADPTSDDMPHGEQLYLETCARFKTAIDAVALTGAASRDQSVTGLRDKLQEGPSWSTLSADGQQQILRGLDAAGRGTC
ncbi:hypothetical protein HQ346_04280 [Rhodococcus sp. BP-252]|uniref:hypothetical protein n=1 Tax=unclassified Rhodococcus (in: high G+C Gram-positive bacteria) TaxID=192944 RepID=UPI001C9B1FD6|nr:MULTISPECIES: hypothetical protein [unclassified Rhodococcus (in: high G+C Gram-positive bacteria)]MBY6410743.1 hypothetical protein [Rhodococcus sp. BP-320]MBY6415432.1 hypothetical protein [Rhodococcus sp. BP-321]MBY6420047.1 hypothetical protein [Rhodococcus sp. BP-324]MBY6425299.1 hypothetical protein [Rhodococcus sp. BP-323]MBY6430638.1 hypothetical protein [Rhodococcus sp. BP-322]